MSLEKVVGMLCLDVAGTLVHNVKTQGVVEIGRERFLHLKVGFLLRQIMEKGVVVTAVTGMRRSSFDVVVKEIPVDYGIIEHGGVVLSKKGEPDTEWREYLEQEIADVQIYKAAIKEAFDPSYPHIQKVLVDDGRLTTFRLMPYKEGDDLIDYPIERIASTLEKVQLNAIPPDRRRTIKLSIDRGYTLQIPSGVEIVEHVPHPPNYECFELHPKSGGKPNAIRFVGNKIGITWNRVAAFGDDLNDVGMLSLARHPFTFAGAKKEVKDIVAGRGGYITDKTTHEGTIDVLTRFLDETVPHMNEDSQII